MIKASENRSARIIFNGYIDLLLKRNFSNFFLINQLPHIPSDTGLIITPNHFSWWDGFFIDYLNRKLLKRSLRIMMLEEQLKRYWFFRFVGAYSINPANPKSIIESAKYTAEEISKPNTLAVIYPQGEIMPYGQRPAGLKQGIKYIAKQIKEEQTIIFPVIFKIQYRSTKLPSVYAYAGNTFRRSTLINNFDHFQVSFNETLCCMDNASFTSTNYKDLFNY